MSQEIEFEFQGLWYAWDVASNGYWAWSDDANDWIEYVGDVPTMAMDSTEEAPLAEVISEQLEEEAPLNWDTDEGEDDGEGVVMDDAHHSNSESSEWPLMEEGTPKLYYVIDESAYYFNGGLVEFDEEWQAYYYFTDPNDPDEYDWVPEEFSNLAEAIQVASHDLLPKKTQAYHDSTTLPGNFIRALSVDLIDVDDVPPELYFDESLSLYFYQNKRVHYKKDKELYYVFEGTQQISLPDQFVLDITEGNVPTWAIDNDDHEDEDEETKSIIEEDQEDEPITKAVDVTPPKPLFMLPPTPTGSQFQLNASDLSIYNAGSERLTNPSIPSLYNDHLMEHYQMSRWGDFLVGRCRRTFSSLIQEEKLATDMVSRLPELTGLVQHLTECQLLSIWKNNYSNIKWTHAAEPQIREFAFKIERSLPFLVFVRCLMRGYDIVEGSTAYFVNKYYPKETVRATVVEQAQVTLRHFNETHIKNMGRVIILAHGAMHLEPRLADYCNENPWWILPKYEEVPGTPEVYYNCKTLQSYTSVAKQRPSPAVKLVCSFRPGETEGSFHVCSA